jgi:hypothetical protein
MQLIGPSKEMLVDQVAPPFVEVLMWPTLFPATIFVPSAEHANDVRSTFGAVLVLQMPPAFVDMKTLLLKKVAASFEPSAEETIFVQFSGGVLLLAQVAPPLVEVKMKPWEAAAASRFPSADDAIETHERLVTNASVHDAPESMERYNAPVVLCESAAAANNLEPSADAARETQLVFGAPVAVQVCALAMLPRVNRPPHSTTPRWKVALPDCIWISSTFNSPVSVVNVTDGVCLQTPNSAQHSMFDVGRWLLGASSHRPWNQRCRLPLRHEVGERAGVRWRA